MSKDNLFPKPWKVGYCNNIWDDRNDTDACSILDRDGHVLFEGVDNEYGCYHAMRKVDAEHICACVNACEDINPKAVPEMLEASDSIDIINHQAEMDSLKSQIKETERKIAETNDKLRRHGITVRRKDHD